MKIRYLLISGLMLGLVACEQPQKKEEQKSEAPKQEAVKQEVKQEAKQEAKQETKQVATASADGDVEKGKALFNAKGCGACHQPAADTVGPSLKKIAQAYGNNVDKLVKFLKGEGKPIVDPAKFAVMKPQLAQLKGLSEGELRAIASYILSHK
ncbi:c-type cytochrome [Aquifex pyrophilus]